MVYQKGQKHRYGSTRIGAFDPLGTPYQQMVLEAFDSTDTAKTKKKKTIIKKRHAIRANPDGTVNYQLSITGFIKSNFEIRVLLKTLIENWLVGWLVGCFGLNGPLRQYFSLYRAVSQREGERKEKY